MLIILKREMPITQEIFPKVEDLKSTAYRIVSLLPLQGPLHSQWLGLLRTWLVQNNLSHLEILSISSGIASSLQSHGWRVVLFCFVLFHLIYLIYLSYHAFYLYFLFFNKEYTALKLSVLFQPELNCPVHFKE